MPTPRDPDSIDVAARLACDAHSQKALSDEGLINILERLIDARACTNGYAERYGLPSQQPPRSHRR